MNLPNDFLPNFLAKSLVLNVNLPFCANFLYLQMYFLGGGGWGVGGLGGWGLGGWGEGDLVPSRKTVRSLLVAPSLRKRDQA